MVPGYFADGSGLRSKQIMIGQEREHWKGRIDFLLASIGAHVGLGNVWRFPYLCYIHGGSAFLLPYIIMTLLVGLPLSFLEYSVGQFTSQGPVTAWSMTPLLSGVGWASVMISAMICVYYNVIIMYSLLYACLSLTNIGWDVPWASCQNRWNIKDLCLDKPLPDPGAFVTDADKISHSLARKNASCVEQISDALGLGSRRSDIRYQFNDFSAFEGNYSQCNIKYSLPAQQYWNNFILELSNDEHIGNIGSLIGRNSMFLLLAWVFVFLCIIRGPRSIAKVVYFTATYPLGILVILLIRGLSIRGFNEGIAYYIVPKWSGLLDPAAWGAAATQCLFTMGISFGGNLTFASYNRFTNNIFRDSIVITAIDCGVSIFAGFVTFALIGSIAHETNIPIRDLIGSGPELVFVIYPQALSSLPAPAIWSFLYFLMVFTLGLDSQFGMMETVVVGFTDRYPDSVGKHRTKFIFVCCLVGFTFGLPLTTKGGIYILTFMNFYAATYAVMILALVELFMVAWIYGVKNFVRDLELMLGSKHYLFWVYWKAMWLLVAPIITAMMFIMAMISYQPPAYAKKEMPLWAESIGWFMVLAPILCVIGRALKLLFYKKIWFKQALQPSGAYRPRHEQNKQQPGRSAENTNKQAVQKNNHKTGENEDCYLTPIHDKNDANIYVTTTELIVRTPMSNGGERGKTFDEETYFDQLYSRRASLQFISNGITDIRSSSV